MSSTASASPEKHLPLTPAVFAILLALVDGEKHGYAIMQEARQHTTMGPGTLYGSIDRLLASGLVRETGISEDERRRYYALTALGKRVIMAETQRLERAIQLARRKGIKASEAKA
ncbi:PadR family transcriptional regulator [Acidobacterium sp. S8]|uniref:PadR family transcriptional regulator n=1 Tax=Acidobacterium sp. S8 TaxID=1641854 RepID=UPI00131BA0A7|nr:PadR family transcriptional regulator [Acidobacterium sp. S8]